MNKKTMKIFLSFQALALSIGNFVGWSTVAKEDNPMTTACFWGSVAFLVAFIWTINLLFVMGKDLKKAQSQLRKLWWLLLVGTLFALVNNVPIIYSFYTQPAAECTTSCLVGTITNPYTTSCFLGFCAFLLSFVFATLAKRYGNRQTG